MAFLLYSITTIVMAFGYPTQATPTPVVLPALWNVGALMILMGGYWFFLLPQGERKRMRVIHLFA